MFELKQVRKKTPRIVCPKRLVAQYSPKNKKDIENLVKNVKKKFVYEEDYNRKLTSSNLVVKPLSVIGGGLGVFATRKIKANSKKPLGYYYGLRRKPKAATNGSAYIFEIVDKKDKLIEEIDAEKRRDWTGLVNHSKTPNIQAIQRKIKGVQEICLCAAKDIQKDEQLLFDYGDGYFFYEQGQPNFKSYYFHASDNWKLPSEVYMENRAFYAEGTYQFDEYTRKTLRLGKVEWLLPTLFLHIYKNNLKRLKQALRKTPVELYAIAYHKKSLNDYSKQQHLTALMYACYLGNEEAVKILLKHGAQVDRCMFTNGWTPFVLLLLGQSDDASQARIASILSDVDDTPSLRIRDFHGMSVLDYAIFQNKPRCAREILDLAKRQSEDLFDIMYDEPGSSKKPHADIDYCIAKSRYEMLAVLLRAIDKSSLKDYIKQGRVFQRKVLRKLSARQLQDLTNVLSKKSIATKLKGTGVLRKM